MPPNSRILPLNARIVSRHGNKSLYVLKDGRLAMMDELTGSLTLDGSRDDSGKAYGSGHNSDWADSRLVSVAKKGGSAAFYSYKAINARQSSVPMTPQEEEPELPDEPFAKIRHMIPKEFLEWAGNYEPGENLPVMPPGYDKMIACSKPINKDDYSQDGVSLEEVVGLALAQLGLPDINPDLTFGGADESIKTKGLFRALDRLGEEIGQAYGNIQDSVLSARGLWRDELNKIRCGSGPNANRFTDVFGTGCDVPGPVDEIASGAGRLAGAVGERLGEARAAMSSADRGSSLTSRTDDIAARVGDAKRSADRAMEEAGDTRKNFGSWLKEKLSRSRGGHTPTIVADSPMDDHDPAAAMRSGLDRSEKLGFGRIRALVSRNKTRERRKQLENTKKEADEAYQNFKTDFSRDFMAANGRMPTTPEVLDAYAKSRGWRGVLDESGNPASSFGGLMDESTLGGTHYDRLMEELEETVRGRYAGDSERKKQQRLEEAKKEFETTIQQMIFAMTNKGGPEYFETVQPDGTILRVPNPEHGKRISEAMPGYIRLSRSGDFPGLEDAYMVTSVNSFANKGFTRDTQIPVVRTTGGPMGTMVRPDMGDLSGTRTAVSGSGSAPKWAVPGGGDEATPFHYTISINPSWLTDDENMKKQRVRALGENHLGMEASRDAFLAHTVDHEINHVDDFGWRLAQKLGYTSESEWRERLNAQRMGPGGQFTKTRKEPELDALGNPILDGSGNPVTKEVQNVIDLRADAKEGTFLRGQIDELDAVLGNPLSSKYDKEKALWNFYMRNIRFNDDIASQYARFLSNNSQTKRDIQRELTDIYQELELRGYGESTGVPSLDFWRDMVDTPTGRYVGGTFVNLDGTPMSLARVEFYDGSSRPEPPMGKGNRLDNSLSNLIYGFIGGTYAGENEWEFMAELRTRLNRPGAHEEIREFLDDPERNVYGLSEEEFFTIAAKMVGEEEVNRITRRPYPATPSGYGPPPGPPGPGPAGPTPPGGGGGGPTPPGGGGLPRPIIPLGGGRGGGGPGPTPPPASPRPPTPPGGGRVRPILPLSPAGGPGPSGGGRSRPIIPLSDPDDPIGPIRPLLDDMPELEDIDSLDVREDFGTPTGLGGRPSSVPGEGESREEAVRRIFGDDGVGVVPPSERLGLRGRGLERTEESDGPSSRLRGRGLEGAGESDAPSGRLRGSGVRDRDETTPTSNPAIRRVLVDRESARRTGSPVGDESGDPTDEIVDPRLDEAVSRREELKTRLDDARRRRDEAYDALQNALSDAYAGRSELSSGDEDELRFQAENTQREFVNIYDELDEVERLLNPGLDDDTPDFLRYEMPATPEGMIVRGDTSRTSEPRWHRLFDGEQYIYVPENDGDGYDAAIRDGFVDRGMVDADRNPIGMQSRRNRLEASDARERSSIRQSNDSADSENPNAGMTRRRTRVGLTPESREEIEKTRRLIASGEMNDEGVIRSRTAAENSRLSMLETQRESLLQSMRRDPLPDRQREILDRLDDINQEIAMSETRLDLFDRHLNNVRNGRPGWMMEGTPSPRRTPDSEETDLPDTREPRPSLRERISNAIPSRRRADDEPRERFSPNIRELREEFGTEERPRPSRSAGDQENATFEPDLNELRARLSGGDDGPFAAMGKTYDRVVEKYDGFGDERKTQATNFKSSVMEFTSSNELEMELTDEEMTVLDDGTVILKGGQQFEKLQSLASDLFGGEITLERDVNLSYRSPWEAGDTMSVGSRVKVNVRVKSVTKYPSDRIIPAKTEIVVEMSLTPADAQTTDRFADMARGTRNLSRVPNVSTDQINERLTIATARRTITIDEFGNISVNHDTLAVRKAARGSGVASDLNARNESLYRALGIKEITTQGSSGVTVTGLETTIHSKGATHWPRNGFTWADEGAKQAFIRIIDDAIRDEPGRFSEEERSRISSLYKKNRDGQFSTNATAEELINFANADSLFAEKGVTIAYKRDISGRGPRSDEGRSLADRLSESVRRRREGARERRETRASRRRERRNQSDWDPTGEAEIPPPPPWDPNEEIEQAIRQRRASRGGGSDSPPSWINPDDPFGDVPPPPRAPWMDSEDPFAAMGRPKKSNSVASVPSRTSVVGRVRNFFNRDRKTDLPDEPSDEIDRGFSAPVSVSARGHADDLRRQVGNLLSPYFTESEINSMTDLEIMEKLMPLLQKTTTIGGEDLEWAMLQTLTNDEKTGMLDASTEAFREILSPEQLETFATLEGRIRARQGISLQEFRALERLLAEVRNGDVQRPELLQPLPNLSPEQRRRETWGQQVNYSMALVEQRIDTVISELERFLQTPRNKGNPDDTRKQRRLIKKKIKGMKDLREELRTPEGRAAAIDRASTKMLSFLAKRDDMARKYPEVAGNLRIRIADTTRDGASGWASYEIDLLGPSVLQVEIEPMLLFINDRRFDSDQPLSMSPTSEYKPTPRESMGAVSEDSVNVYGVESSWTNVLMSHEFAHVAHFAKILQPWGIDPTSKTPVVEQLRKQGRTLGDTQIGLIHALRTGLNPDVTIDSLFGVTGTVYGDQLKARMELRNTLWQIQDRIGRSDIFADVPELSALRLIFPGERDGDVPQKHQQFVDAARLLMTGKLLLDGDPEYVDERVAGWASRNRKELKSILGMSDAEIDAMDLRKVSDVIGRLQSDLKLASAGYGDEDVLSLLADFKSSIESDFGMPIDSVGMGGYSGDQVMRTLGQASTYAKTNRFEAVAEAFSLMDLLQNAGKYSMNESQRREMQEMIDRILDGSQAQPAKVSAKTREIAARLTRIMNGYARLQPRRMAERPLAASRSIR